MQPPIEVRFNTTLEDWIALYQHQSRRSTEVDHAIGRARANMSVLVGLVTFSVFALGYATTMPPADPLIRGLLLSSGILVAGPLIWMKTLTRRECWRRIDRGIERRIRAGRVVGVVCGPLSVTLTPEATVTTSNDATCSFNWSSKTVIAVESDAIYLTFTNGGLVRIPLRAFSTPAEQEEFLKAMHERSGVA